MSISASQIASSDDRLSVPGHRLDREWEPTDQHNTQRCIGGSCKCGEFGMDTTSAYELTHAYRLHLAEIIVEEREALRQRMGLT